MRYARALDLYTVRSVDRSLEVEVGDIKRDELGVFLIEGAIYDKLDEIQGSSFGNNVTRVSDVIAADGDAGAIGVGFLRSDETDHFGVSDFFAPILWDVLV